MAGSVALHALDASLSVLGPHRRHSAGVDSGDDQRRAGRPVQLSDGRLAARVPQIFHDAVVGAKARRRGELAAALGQLPVSHAPRPSFSGGCSTRVQRIKQSDDNCMRLVPLSRQCCPLAAMTLEDPSASPTSSFWRQLVRSGAAPPGLAAGRPTPPQGVEGRPADMICARLPLHGHDGGRSRGADGADRANCADTKRRRR